MTYFQRLKSRLDMVHYSSSLSLKLTSHYLHTGPLEIDCSILKVNHAIQSNPSPISYRNWRTQKPFLSFCPGENEGGCANSASVRKWSPWGFWAWYGLDVQPLPSSQLLPFPKLAREICKSLHSPLLKLGVRVFLMSSLKNQNLQNWNINTYFDVFRLGL